MMGPTINDIWGIISKQTDALEYLHQVELKRQLQVQINTFWKVMKPIHSGTSIMDFSFVAFAEGYNGNHAEVLGVNTVTKTLLLASIVDSASGEFALTIPWSPSARRCPISDLGWKSPMPSPTTLQEVTVMWSKFLTIVDEEVELLPQLPNLPWLLGYTGTKGYSVK